VVTLVAVLIAVLILQHHGGPSASAAAGSTSHTGTTKPKNTTTTIGVTGPGTSTTTLPPVSPNLVRLQVLNGIGSGLYAGQFSTRLHTNPGYQGPDVADLYRIRREPGRGEGVGCHLGPATDRHRGDYSPAFDRTHPSGGWGQGRPRVGGRAGSHLEGHLTATAPSAAPFIGSSPKATSVSLIMAVNDDP
jgi:hypothetical protein